MDNRAAQIHIVVQSIKDGCVATTFHAKCNNKGATVTVLYNASGSVYGGYTSVAWRNANTIHSTIKHSCLGVIKFLEELKANIEHYKPLKELKIQQARILLVGQVGAGNRVSSNTINSIFGDTSLVRHAVVTEHSLTTVFNPSLPISPEIPGFITSPQLSNKIHCVAFVMDSSTVDVF
ncbi:unnamed protein product [Mytilus edulis]|uniref:TLDc domain-containing protein n=1 Tax=Mytilus edulis TaxID=6550 RepID=A0A8S3PVN0_MYTED|nr:unnamed protein product [Mytilus edulis]